MTSPTTYCTRIIEQRRTTEVLLTETGEFSNRYDVGHDSVVAHNLAKLTQPLKKKCWSPEFLLQQRHKNGARHLGQLWHTGQWRIPVAAMPLCYQHACEATVAAVFFLSFLQVSAQGGCHSRPTLVMLLLFSEDPHSVEQACLTGSLQAAHGPWAAQSLWALIIWLAGSNGCLFCCHMVRVGGVLGAVCHWCRQHRGGVGHVQVILRGQPSSRMLVLFAAPRCSKVGYP